MRGRIQQLLHFTDSTKRCERSNLVAEACYKIRILRTPPFRVHQRPFVLRGEVPTKLRLQVVQRVLIISAEARGMTVEHAEERIGSIVLLGRDVCLCRPPERVSKVRVELSGLLEEPRRRDVIALRV